MQFHFALESELNSPSHETSHVTRQFGEDLRWEQACLIELSGRNESERSKCPATLGDYAMASKGNGYRESKRIEKTQMLKGNKK